MDLQSIEERLSGKISGGENCGATNYLTCDKCCYLWNNSVEIRRGFKDVRNRFFPDNKRN